MNPIRVGFLMTWLVSFCVNGWALDLSQIDRSLVKEPSYRNAAPTYNLLVFGPEAKTRLWLVLDGRDLYVDKNCDGELSTTDERFERDGEKLVPFEITDQAGGERYRIDRVQVIRIDRPDQKMTLLSAYVTILGKYRQYSGATPSANRQEAPVSHFHGPLTVDLNRDEKGNVKQQLVVGDASQELAVMIGTLDYKNGCWVVIENRVRGAADDFPADLHPVASVEFSPKQEGVIPEPIKNPLAERC